MCGITGLVDTSNNTSKRDTIERMTMTVAHRGPDGQGIWHDSGENVWFGHRRLSILDLSPSGAQPMTTEDDRHAITFNGEAYNHTSLREKLSARGHRFRGRSDTEVILAAFAEWGVVEALPRLHGMFGLAVWDAQTCSLTLARDRFGKKPLYWRLDRAGRLLFASEMKALETVDSLGGVSRSALEEVVQFGCVRAPRTIYAGVNMIMPGTALTFRLDALGSPTCHAYWDAHSLPSRRPRDEAASAVWDPKRLDGLLGASVAKRMVADVPVGSLLSGGIDSSLVTALMQERSAQPVRTFTIGFAESSHDESALARATAEHLGTDHTERIVTAEDALKVITDLPRIYDEPFGDSSQIPTILVSRLARGRVKVALSGDGGDEVFGGYNRYRLARGRLARARGIPLLLRRGMAAGILAMRPTLWDTLLSARGGTRKSPFRQPGEKAHKFARVLRASDDGSAYESLISAWGGGSPVLARGDAGLVKPATPTASSMNFLDRMMLADTLHYLPNDILTKVDRASMSVGLEMRAPLLDHELAEFAWALPRSALFDERGGKAPLRTLLAQRVPTALLDRPKSGFALPIGEWLRGPLRTWAEDLLEERRLRKEGYLDARLVRDLWARHLGGRINAHEALWHVLMFQHWLDHRGESSRSPDGGRPSGGARA